MLLEHPAYVQTNPLRHVTATWVLRLLVIVNFAVPARAGVPPFGAAGRPTALLALGCFLWWVLESLSPYSRGRRLTPVHYALLLSVVAALLSVTIGMHRAASPAEVSGSSQALISTIGTLGIAFLAADCVNRWEDIERIFRTAVTAGAIMSVVAIIQFGFGVGALEPTQYLVLPGFTELGDNPPITWRNGLRRVAGSALHPIELSVVAAGLLLFALHFALHAKDRVDAQRRWAEVGLLSLAIAVSLSRSGVVAIAAGGLMLVGAWTNSQRLRATFVGLAGLVFFYAFDPRVIDTFIKFFAFAGNDDPSVTSRTDDYELVSLVAEYPITGRGAGTFLPSEYFILDNQLLGTLIQSGAIGLFALIAFYIIGFVLPRHVRAMADGKNELASFSQAMAAFVFAAFVAAFTFDSMAFPMHRTMLFATVGLGAALWRLARAGQVPGLRPEYYESQPEPDRV